MKVEKAKTFTSIKIVLESQEEVDKLYAIFNHASINKALSLSDFYEELSSYSSPDYRHYHEALVRIIS